MLSSNAEASSHCLAHVNDYLFNAKLMNQPAASSSQSETPTLQTTNATNVKCFILWMNKAEFEMTKIHSVCKQAFAAVKIWLGYWFAL